MTVKTVKLKPSIEDFKKIELTKDNYWHDIFINYRDMIKEDLAELTTVEQVKNYVKEIKIPICLTKNPLWHPKVNPQEEDFNTQQEWLDHINDVNTPYIMEWVVDYDNPTVVREITFQDLALAEYVTKVYERQYTDFNNWISYNDILYNANITLKIKYLHWKRKMLASLQDWAKSGCNLKACCEVGQFISWWENKYPNHHYTIKHNVDMTLKFYTYIEKLEKYMCICEDTNADELVKDYTDEWALKELKEEIIDTFNWCVFDSDTMNDALNYFIDNGTPLTQSCVRG